MFVAAYAMIPGIAVLAFSGVVGPLAAFFAGAICAIVGAGLFTMAATTAGVLADVRAQLVSELERRRAAFE
jgi:hypothetical protein